jgi:hypothetical protein
VEGVLLAMNIVERIFAHPELDRRNWRFAHRAWIFHLVSYGQLKPTLGNIPGRYTPQLHVQVIIEDPIFHSPLY